MDSLQDILSSQIPSVEQEFSVSHYVANGKWDWARTRHWITEAICQKIAVINPPSAGLPDCPCWRLASDGLFSLKSAYGVATEVVTDSTQ